MACQFERHWMAKSIFHANRKRRPVAFFLYVRGLLHRLCASRELQASEACYPRHATLTKTRARQERFSCVVPFLLRSGPKAQGLPSGTGLVEGPPRKAPVAADLSLARSARSSILSSPLFLLLVKANTSTQAGAEALRRAAGPMDAVLLRSVGRLDGTPGRGKAEKAGARWEDSEKHRRVQVVPLLASVHAGCPSRADAVRAGRGGGYIRRLD